VLSDVANGATGHGHPLNSFVGQADKNAQKTRMARLQIAH
jgi:hypothetical protein